MRRLQTDRDPRAQAIAAALWGVLWIGAITVVVMTWHPWVIGAHGACPAGQLTGWDGHCRPA